MEDIINVTDHGNLKVETIVDDGLIISKMTDLAGKIHKRVVDTQDEQIKKALMALGWRPPKKKSDISYGQIAYQAYAMHTDWYSLATGDPLPPWDGLRQAIQEAWEEAAAAVFSNAY